jgi:hypothetical protein
MLGTTFEIVIALLLSLAVICGPLGLCILTLAGILTVSIVLSHGTDDNRTENLSRCRRLLLTGAGLILVATISIVTCGAMLY